MLGEIVSRLAGLQLSFQMPSGTGTYSRISPNGREVLTGNTQGFALLWDLRSGAIRHKLEHGSQTVSVINGFFSRDGSTVATRDSDGKIFVWDGATGAKRAALESEAGAWGLALNHDGSQVTTGRELWDVASGKRIWEIRGNLGTRFVTFSPDDKLVVSSPLCGMNLPVRIIRAQDGRELRTLPLIGTSCPPLAFLGNDILASGNSDGRIRIWKAGALERVLELGNKEPYWLAVNKDFSRLAAGGVEGVTRVWEPRSGALLSTIHQPGSLLHGTLSPDGERLVTAVSDGKVTLWDTRTGSLRFTYQGHTSDAMLSYFSPEGSSILSGGADNTLMVWSADVARWRRSFDGLPPTMASAQFVNRGTKIVGASVAGLVVRWDAATGATDARMETGEFQAFAASEDGQKVAFASKGGLEISVQSFSGGTGARSKVSTPANSLCFTPDGSRLAIAIDNLIVIQNSTTGETLRTISGDFRGHGLVFNNDASRLLASSESSIVELDVAGGQPTRVFRGHTATILNARYSRDGTKVISGSMDGTSNIFDASSGRLLLRLDERKPDIFDADLAPSNRYAATVSSDGSMLLWDAQTGAALAQVKERGGVNTLQFAPDGQQMLTASEFGDVRLWQVAASYANQATVALQKCRAPYALDGERLVHAHPDLASCAALKESSR
jgi:WD40 repeat protein